MTAKTKKLLTILLTTLAIAAFVITPLAWFASYWDSNLAGVTTGKNAKLPAIDMWMYDSTEVTDDSGNKAPVGWGKVNAVIDKDGEEELGYLVPSTSEQENDDGTYSFDLEKMHFGVVDNLGALKEDNIVYIRLTVDAQKSGANKLIVGLDYLVPTPTAEDLYKSVTLYGKTSASGNSIVPIAGNDLKSVIVFPETTLKDENGTVLKDENNNDIKIADVSDPGCRFMQIACAVTTNEKVIPGGTGEYISVDTLDFTEFSFVGNEIVIDLTSADYLNSDAYTGTYYVYLKIAPSLEFFSAQDKLLDKFVPSYIFFDTKLKIELY